MAPKSRSKKTASGKTASGDNSQAERLPFEPKKAKSKTRQENPEVTAAASDAKTAEVVAPEEPNTSAAKAKADEILAAAQAAKLARESKSNPAGALDKSSPKKSNSSKSNPKSNPRKGSTTIPEVVSQRMFGRMVIFSGIPSLLGLMIFPISYLIVTQKWFELPNTVVVVLSLGMFGLGVFGLSYGVLSASWDEVEPGSSLGWQEFRTNLGRVTEGWRNRNQPKSSGS